MTQKYIELRGVRTKNLKDLDLTIPHGQFLVVCGPSGSGKTSLAVDTLYAEGQRRYIESFSPYARQFLDQVDKPPAEELRGIPPAIAVTGRGGRFGRRANIASTIEFHNHLQMVFTRGATVICPDCQMPVVSQHPHQVAEQLLDIPAGTRFQIGFSLGDQVTDDLLETFRANGFVRAIVGTQTRNLSELTSALILGQETWVIVDRLTGGKVDPHRLNESLSSAFQFGNGTAFVWLNELPAAMNDAARPEVIDQQDWFRKRFDRDLTCARCARRFVPPEPQRLSDASPLGACLECEGLGEVSNYDPQLIIPDETKSIRDGAIAPWNSPSYEHERHELLALAADYGINVDIPWSELPEEQRRLIWKGIPEREFGGLDGFFRWLEKRRYKMHLRIFTARWRSFTLCPVCRGQRLNANALHYQFGGKTIVEIYGMTLAAAREFFEKQVIEYAAVKPVTSLLPRVVEQLSTLEKMGLGYLTLNQKMQSLSSGEKHRILIGRMLKTSLVNLLYVLDEPSSGLHPIDTEKLVTALAALHARNNTVVVVDHDPQVIVAGERVIEMGPAAGEQGGTIVFDGSPEKIVSNKKSITGRYIQGENWRRPDATRRVPKKGKLRLLGCTGHHLQNIDVDFPLGVLCQVMGLSGSGKTSLVRDTLFSAVARHLQQDAPTPLPHKKIVGEDLFSSTILIDDAPLVRSSRSNPATHIKVYDLIRKLFAESEDAKSKNLTARHFSFNVSGGRCEKCTGVGYLDVDMHFLSEMRVVCDQCQGRRFRSEVLQAKYRGKNIVETLALTAQQAFAFFRGQRKIQLALKSLIDVGLGYLQLGQPNDTLSAGEERRLKLAQHLAQTSKGRSLFVIIRPTIGLHLSEISKLVDCCDSLLGIGHSIIVVDNSLALAQHADWLIEMGPGAGQEGGRVVFSGTPEEMRLAKNSPTGQALTQWLGEQ